MPARRIELSALHPLHLEARLQSRYRQGYGSDVIFAIREESAGGGISYLIATMDSVIEVVANLLRIRGDDFHTRKNRQ